jgi:hypothetical protein
VVILFAGLATLAGSLLLVPGYGLTGVGYAYVLGSLPAFVGLVHCWYHMFGRASTTDLLRLIGLPLAMGAMAFAVAQGTRNLFGEIGWLSLFGLGGLFTAVAGLLIAGADWATGGEDAQSKVFLRILLRSKRVEFLFHRLSLMRAR